MYRHSKPENRDRKRSPEAKKITIERKRIRAAQGKGV